LLDLLSDEKVAVVADAAVGDGVVGGVFGTGVADPIDFDEAVAAKAAASKPILIEAADWGHEGSAGLVGCAVDLVAVALAAGPVDQVVPEGADAGLLG